MHKYRKDKIVDETKELASTTRTNAESGEVTICDRSYIVLPKVFDPRVFFSTNWFASSIAKLVQGESSFCEVGCGTGAVTITTLLENPELQAVAVDINPHAVQNTKENSEKYGLVQRLEVFESDVFNAIPSETTFDSIFWAMPFGYLEEGESVDVVDTNTFDPGYRAIKKFFETADQYLKPDGRLLVGFSHEIGNDELLEDLTQKNNFSLALLLSEEGTEKSPVTMQIYECKKV